MKLEEYVEWTLGEGFWQIKEGYRHIKIHDHLYKSQQRAAGQLVRNNNQPLWKIICSVWECMTGESENWWKKPDLLIFYSFIYFFCNMLLVLLFRRDGLEVRCQYLSEKRIIILIGWLAELQGRLHLDTSGKILRPRPSISYIIGGIIFKIIGPHGEEGENDSAGKMSFFTCLPHLVCSPELQRKPDRYFEKNCSFHVVR